MPWRRCRLSARSPALAPARVPARVPRRRDQRAWRLIPVHRADVGGAARGRPARRDRGAALGQPAGACLRLPRRSACRPVGAPAADGRGRPGARRRARTGRGCRPDRLAPALVARRRRLRADDVCQLLRPGVRGSAPRAGRPRRCAGRERAGPLQRRRALAGRLGRGGRAVEHRPVERVLRRQRRLVPALRAAALRRCASFDGPAAPQTGRGRAFARRSRCCDRTRGLPPRSRLWAWP